MTTYKVIPNKGSVRYLKDGKIYPKNKIKLHILEALGKDGEYTDNDKYCIFCQEVTKYYRMLDQQPVALCQQHYQNKTLGAIAQHLREENNG